jgi:hypothetical protein
VRRGLALVLSLQVALVGAVTTGVSAGGGVIEPVAPVLVPGARVVDVRNGEGGLSRFTTIPSTSVFQTYGGRTATCSFTSPFGGTTSDGQRYVAGQLVRSRRWIFIEGLPEAIGEPNVADPSQQRGPLASAVRWFTVFCDTVNHFVAVISVTSRDPMLDPRTRVTDLYNGLLLERPVVAADPVVQRWGGAITRFPLWLGVQPSAWRVQRSNSAVWRGWTMYLVATPVSLEFAVRSAPDPTRPSAPFAGTVPCVSPARPGTAGAVSFPRRPVLPAQTAPGANGPCTWTAGGPGTVTVQPRIAYRVTFWANGYTETLPDYVWTGSAVTWRTGELSAVNANG